MPDMPSVFERIMKKRYKEMSSREIHKLSLVSGIVSGIAYSTLFGISMNLLGKKVTLKYSIFSAILFCLASYAMGFFAIQHKKRKNKNN